VSDDPGEFAVVGTDTGVGKTVVTAALVAHLRDVGLDGKAIKPAQTGYPEDDDAGYIQEICGAESATRLRTYAEPLAPAVAARRAGETLDFDSLLADTRDALAAAELGVVEGAGGLRVPLSTAPQREIVDLIADLGVPAVVVARSGLGTLNHTALTVEALRRREIPVAGVALNRYEGAGVAERTNPEELKRMCDCRVQTLPEIDSDSAEAVRDLGKQLEPIVDELA